MAHTRITSKQLDSVAQVINDNTPHKVKLVHSQGCGVYVIIDGREYYHTRRDGSTEGLKNRDAMLLLKPLYFEAFNS